MERRRGPGEGGIGGGGSDEDWLHDYAVGSNFEVYSVPLEVLSGDSSLWGLSFSRQASKRATVFVVRVPIPGAGSGAAVT